MAEPSPKSLNPDHNKAPEHIQNIHLMGICGTGMAALAGMLQQKGFTVKGSDSQVYPPMSDFLEKLGIEICEGYHPDNLHPTPDLVIVGNVIRQVNPEAQELARTTIPYLSFPQALAHFFIEGKTSLVVTGTHGKTTTCSLLASCLFRANQSPGYMIGGIVQQFGSNFMLGDGPCFISEGDEYDTAFFNKVSKFLHYRPQVAIITSLEFDHADIFDNLDAIKDSFREFVSLLPPDGLIIAHTEDEHVADVVRDANCEVKSYGLQHENDWSVSNLSVEAGTTSFSVYQNGRPYGDFTVALPGKHNVLNSLSVIAVCEYLGLEKDLYSKGLESFGGVKRRQEVRGIEADVTVIDDFAHHPTAVRETLNALKESYRGKRLICVFEPRTNSSRRSIFQDAYAEAFGAADMVLVREPVPMESVSASEMFSSLTLKNALGEKGIPAWSFASADEILVFLEDKVKKGDVIAILSNGGFENIHTRLLEQLRTTTPS